VTSHSTLLVGMLATLSLTSRNPETQSFLQSFSNGTSRGDGQRSLYQVVRYIYRTNEQYMRTDGKRAPLQIFRPPLVTRLRLQCCPSLGPVNLGTRLPIGLAQPQLSAFRISYLLRGHCTLPDEHIPSLCLQCICFELSPARMSARHSSMTV
jgi:hypothetical protein